LESVLVLQPYLEVVQDTPVPQDQFQDTVVSVTFSYVPGLHADGLVVGSLSCGVRVPVPQTPDEAEFIPTKNTLLVLVSAVELLYARIEYKYEPATLGAVTDIGLLHAIATVVLGVVTIGWLLSSSRVQTVLDEFPLVRV
jgi:hypothetical protein